MINQQRSRNNNTERSYGLIWGTILAFALRVWGKPRKDEHVKRRMVKLHELWMVAEEWNNILLLKHWYLPTIPQGVTTQTSNIGTLLSKALNLYPSLRSKGEVSWPFKTRDKIVVSFLIFSVRQQSWRHKILNRLTAKLTYSQILR